MSFRHKYNYQQCNGYKEQNAKWKLKNKKYNKAASFSASQKGEP